MPGDSIYVNRKPGVVEIQGEVYNPGLVTYNKGRGLMSYIKSAGGIKPTGNKRDILIVCANGNVKPNGQLFFHPTVGEGATIIVNQKPVQEPFSLNQLLRDTASMVASMAMIYFVLAN
jgi:protein involved in polysaccharide export with SLBB domain